MALDTYTNLKTAVANWLNKSNLTARIPDFIGLAEADISRRLRVRDLEAQATGTLSGATLALPTRFSKVKSFTIVVSGVNVVLEYMAPAQLREQYMATATDIPSGYTITNGAFQIAPVPDGNYAYTLDFYQKLEPLSDSVATNWVLTNHPDLYLYGSLLQAEPFLKNDERMATWAALYEAGLQRVKDADINDRFATRAAQTTRRGTP